MTTAAEWEVVATECQMRADAATFLANTVRLSPITPEWFAKRARAQIRDAYTEMAATFTDLAETTAAYAASAAEHEVSA